MNVEYEKVEERGGRKAITIGIIARQRPASRNNKKNM